MPIRVMIIKQCIKNQITLPIGVMCLLEQCACKDQIRDRDSC